MPENAEAYIISDQLREKIKGKIIQSYKLSGLLKVIHFDTLKLPSIIENVKSYGKKVIIELSEQLIIISLGMSGKFKFDDQKHNHVTFILNDLTLYYNDVRRIGSSIEIIDICNYDIYLEKLGPCLLGSALTEWITPKKWKQLFYKSGNRAIIDILMDQSKISGVGNYLRIDILYLAGVYPFRVVNDITKRELELIRIASHEIVLLAYKMGGHTLLDYVDTNNNKGGYEPLIYGQRKDHNGFTVNNCKFNGRTVYYVKEVQL